MTHDSHEHDEVLRELFGSLRAHTSPRPAHKQELRERLLAALQHVPAAEKAPPLSIRRYRLVWAAAAVVLLALGVWLLVEVSSNVATADFSVVGQKIRDARTVSYRWHIQLPSRPATDVRVYMNQDGIVRTEDEKKVRILDYPERIFLILNLDTKQANLVKEALPEGATDEDAMVRFRSLYASHGTFIGRQALDGREMLAFEVRQPDAKLLILVDPKTEFPVRIEVRDASPARRLVEMLDDFTWNADLPASLFSTEVPDGYTLWEQVEPPTEQNLVEMLRVCARIGQGAFPRDLDKLTIAPLVRADVQSRLPSASAPSIGNLTVAVADTDEQGRIDMKACVRGLKFIETLPHGTWRYTGADVKLGQRKPVFLWRPTGEESWHVIYGDFELGQMKDDEIPPAPSKDEPASQPAE